MQFLIGHPIASTIAGVTVGALGGFFVADSGLIDFGGGMWNDKVVTGVAYGATLGAVPGVMTGMGNPNAGIKSEAEQRKLAEEEQRKADMAQGAMQDRGARDDDYDDDRRPQRSSAPSRMHPDDVAEYEEFRQWRNYVRDRERAAQDRELFGDDYARG